MNQQDEIFEQSGIYTTILPQMGLDAGKENYSDSSQ